MAVEPSKSSRQQPAVRARPRPTTSAEGASALVVTAGWLLVSSHQIRVCLAGAAKQFRASPAEERLERPGPGAIRLKLAVERVTVVHVPEWSRDATAPLVADMVS